MLDPGDYIQSWPRFWADRPRLDPWDIPAGVPTLLERAFAGLGGGYLIADGVAVHHSATVEIGAVLKGPAIVGPGCFLAAHCYLRGGVWLAGDCVVGPGCEVKSSIVFEKARFAHFNFVGDSLVGSDVNLEAGAIVANYRNDLADRRLRIQLGDTVLSAEVEKFGALIGDGVRIGANAVVAPGAVLQPGAVVRRLELVDQRPV